MTDEQAYEIWDMMFSQWPKDSVFRFFARTAGGRVHGQAVKDPEDLKFLSNWCCQNGWNAYVQLNPTKERRWARVSSRDITHWSWFPIDIDPTGPNPRLEDAKSLIEDLMRGVFGLGELTRAVVYSGRGMQMWYPLAPLCLKGPHGGENLIIKAEPMNWITNEMEAENASLRTVTKPAGLVAQRVMAFWTDYLRRRVELVGSLHEWNVTIDTSVTDLPRVMRMPYTWNFKANKATLLLEKFSKNNPTLGRKMIEYAPYRLWKALERPVGGEDLDCTTPWQRFLPYITRAARIFLTEGEEEGGRHRAAAAALLSLKELGCSGTQTRAALLWGASLCSPPLESREIMPMIERHFKQEEA